eukprot:CAMPEP_0117670680 /NCGR_PEP_ID=MMETSP0804-20121206/12906_1 /TAXON_ID=1074897 /ORGANISM="Tetraselmis astigmatica, Strain CCMP880" /LENGTH=422 /DNA_ID=CAMNT_0005479043 /DNA_START=142 /DNA_END=1410 /DNA_ORIENTATION=+
MSACCARICSRPSRSTWALLSGGERGSSSNTRPLGQSARRPQQRSLACHATSDELGKDENVKLFYASLANLEHDQVGHPEKGARVPAIMGTLEKYGLRGDAMSSDRRQELVELHNLRPATVEEVAAVHVPAYPKELPTICMEKGPGVLEGGGPTYFTAGTSEAAFRSAGAGMQLVDLAVATSRHRSGVPGAAGFGVCRPPGHHAIPQGPMGFCVFNNISIMARYAQEVHGLKKVMIFDFDVHHGNGTHDTFFYDPSVLFISTHQAGGYPGTGQLLEVGEGDGEGYSINLPLPGDSGDYAMMAVFEEVVRPAAARFQPDIILVSAGYDAHWRDPLAGLQFRTITYHWLTKELRRLSNELCDGRIVFMLEGGYDLKALGESVTNSFLALLDCDAQDNFNPMLLRDEPLDKIRAAIHECQKIHEL